MTRRDPTSLRSGLRARFTLRWSALRRRAGSVAALVALACAPRSAPQAPNVPPSSTLDLAGIDVHRPAPYAIAHVAPEGPTTGDPSVFVVLSRATRPLGPDAPVPEGLSLSPSVEGHWEWVGAHGLSFVPAGGRLPRATSFEVSVPSGLTSLEGETLSQGRTFAFQTPRPRVTQMWPQPWERSADPQDPILLQLSQPAEPSAVAPHILARANEAQLEIQVTRGKNSSELRVQAKGGWPKDSEIALVAAPGWRGEEGPLGATHRFEGSFRTYGPLTASVECPRDPQGRCLPHGGLSLRLSNPVLARTLSRAIRADGVELRVDQDWDAKALTQSIDLGVALRPREKFSIVVDPILDVHGQPLRWVKHRQVEVADYPPSVRVGFSGDSFLPEQEELTVQARNTGYELATSPLDPEALSGIMALPRSQRFDALVRLPGVARRTVARGKLNEWQPQTLPLGDLTRRGLFAVGVRYQVAGEVRSELRWGQRTDLGVTTKSGRDRAVTWVTRLSSGAPIDGATVRVVGAPGSTRTNASGLAHLPPGLLVSRPDEDGAKSGTEWLEVRLGSEVAYRSTDERISAWRLPVAADFWGRDEDLGLLFPERDLFRPGDSAWVKGYLRRPVTTGTVALRNVELALELVSPTGELSQTLRVKSNDYGAVAHRLRIPAAAQLGYWTLRLRRGKQVYATASVRVAEVRPTEFEVGVRSEQASVIAGEPISWHVEGTYLSGGAMASAGVETSLRREQAWFSPPGYEQLVSDDSAWQRFEDYRPYSAYLESSQGELSEQGQLGQTSASQLAGQVGPERLELEATVTDLSAQTVSRRAGVLVHPAAFYPVIEPLPSSFVDAPALISARVLAVTPEGTPLSNQLLSVTLHRVRWTHVKQPGSGNASATTSVPLRDLVDRCSATSAREIRSCQLRVPQAGQYILRVTSTDKAGRSVSSSLDFSAMGKDGAAAWLDEDERGLVQLSADKSSYRQGQTARILVKSPFERAFAWITVERNGVLEGRVERLTGTSPSIPVPVTRDMQPSAFVGVHLIEDRKSLGTKAHAIPESYRFGYVELRLDPEARRLGVNVTSDKSSYRPGEQVRLSFSAKDTFGRGHRSELAVFVVDEGVLGLSGYELPDPLETFLRPRPLRVETLESRESIARNIAFEPNLDENKGDPGGGGDGERSEQVTAAYFNPSILTDAQGHAEVTFPLPDNIGRFRVMAAAVSEDDYFGTGRGSVTVNQRLMVRPALPRFLRAGDRFDAALTLQGLEFPGGDVEVKAAVSGATLLAPKTTTTLLPRDGARLVSFPARVDRVGEATFRFLATSPTGKDSVRVTRPVRTPAQLEAVALYGKTKTAEGHRLGQLDGVRPDMGQLDVTLASSALVGLEGGFEQLWDYPYACSEQLASRALPLLVLRDLASLYGVQAPKDAERRIEDAVGQLVRRQRGDGGFGMWPESKQSAPWVSAYVLWVLFEAGQRGHHVDKSSFERGVRFLRSVAAKRKDEDLTEAALASLVLGRLGHPDPETVTALYEKVDQMPVEAQILLAWAAVEAKKEGGTAAVARALVARVESSITLRGDAAEITAPHGEAAAAIMSSDARRHALALQALLAAHPDHVLAAPLVRALLDARTGMGWQSTQETAFALLGLDAYRRAQEREEPDLVGRVFLANELLGQARFLGRGSLAREFSVEMKQLVQGGDLVFQQAGQGTLFYEARLRYARRQLPVEPLENGFAVEKRMMSVQANPMSSPPSVVVDERTMDRGAVVLVELTVVVPSRRRYVVIDDPLPAGLEAIDPNLTTSQASLSGLSSDPGGGFSYAWHRSELRDDRVLYFVDDMPAGVYRYRYLARATTVGQFVTPPTRAMEMYQPEVYGRTGARTVTIGRSTASPTGSADRAPGARPEAAR